jgi:hypothetical protein
LQSNTPRARRSETAHHDKPRAPHPSRALRGDLSDARLVQLAVKLARELAG